MACCGCDDRPNEEADEEAGPTRPDRRGCTDMLCCCMLLVYWIGMVLIFAVALMLGNPCAAGARPPRLPRAVAPC